ncbi:MAG: RAMP superfamily CRISPR-associated protein [Cyanobacteriota bacterium]
MGKTTLYTAPMLTKLLAQQHQKRSPDLFKQGIFTLQWRGKVGSFPYPDLETIVSAGEPCGRWEWKPDQDFGQMNQRKHTLPLNGYIPASAIRGIVRAWAKTQGIQSRMEELLGRQEDNAITSGKIEFLDAWPETPTKLALDITNPQENFQVHHKPDEQGKPLPLYTLGNGHDFVEVTVAIRGIPNTQVTKTDVDEVWGWVQQALSFYGVGSRTASGYGQIKPTQKINLDLPKDYQIKEFGFSLYSQGCHGPSSQKELRPSHWRGWLRSWTLRCLLGVMSKDDAQLTLEELFGTLESNVGGRSKQGQVRIEMLRGNEQQFWGDGSSDQPDFYAWKGKLQISAPTETLELIILPIVKFAVSVGGVGRGWRRPLHIFMMTKRDRRTNQESQEPASRGTYLTLLHREESGVKNFALPLKSQVWQETYSQWQEAIQKAYPDRYSSVSQNPEAEVFSSGACAVYFVPGPTQEPLDKDSLEWAVSNPTATRGKGMDKIYDSQYKRKPDVGGNAAGGGNAHCSWVSIKRVPVKDAGTKEVVCLFMGGQTPQSNHLRANFLRDLASIPGAVHLFGVKPDR